MIGDSPILETRGLSKRFGGLVALDRMDFRVETGDLRAIIGPNGAGKTTFFNLISGQLPPDQGEVFFRGEPVTGLPAHRLAHMGIGRTLQVTSIFTGLSVEENLWVGVNSVQGEGNRPGAGGTRLGLDGPAPTAADARIGPVTRRPAAFGDRPRPDDQSRHSADG